MILSMKIKVTLQVDDDLWAQTKRYAADNGQTLSTVVESALREFLRSHSSGQARITLITHHGGPFQPGIDIDKSAVLQDLMDGLL